MNRRILVLATIVAIVSSFFVVATPSSIASAASCSTLSGKGNFMGGIGGVSVATVSVNRGDTVTLTYTSTGGAAGGINFFDTNNTFYASAYHLGNAGTVSAKASKAGTAQFYIATITALWDYTFIVTVCHPTVPLPPFPDGRCNQEAWQSFALYPDGSGGWVFYALFQSVGRYAMHVTKAFLDAHPDTGVNHIIAQSDGVQLWRLAGGLLQAHRVGMDGKDYSFNLDHCDGVPPQNFPPPVPNTF